MLNISASPSQTTAAPKNIMPAADKISGNQGRICFSQSVGIIC